MFEKMKVQGSCGCYVGEAKWRQGADDWYKEPDECCWEGIVEVDKEDWEDGCASIHCPKCHAELTQDMDHFQLLDESEVRRKSIVDRKGE